MSNFIISKGTKVEISSRVDGKMKYTCRKTTSNMSFNDHDVVISPETAYENHGIINCDYYTFQYKHSGQMFWVTVKQALLTMT